MINGIVKNAKLTSYNRMFQPYIKIPLTIRLLLKLGLNLTPKVNVANVKNICANTFKKN